MKLLSINVSRPVEVQHEGKALHTGIFKKPVSGPVKVGRTNLEGDGQADLENHGGESKAVYAYSHDHYAWWREKLGRSEMPFGQFGENLTVEGLDETQSFIGDHLEIGTALFAISQPRVPCFKLGIRMDDPKVPAQFTQSSRTGYYLRVLREGTVEAGDAVTVVQRGRNRVPVNAVFDAMIKRQAPDLVDLLQRTLEIRELADEWREPMQKLLQHKLAKARKAPG
jgi:MOSC domain-containing protein YiiM